MSTITIDGQTYALDTLSDEAKAQLLNLRACDQKIQQLQLDLAIVQTARNAYAQALKSLLPTPTEQAMQSETLKFGE